MTMPQSNLQLSGDFKKSVTINDTPAPSRLVDGTPLPSMLETVIGRQYNINELLAQLTLDSSISITITTTMARHYQLFAFSHSSAGWTTNMSTSMNRIKSFFKRIHFDVTIHFQLTGILQNQGALMINSIPDVVSQNGMPYPTPNRKDILYPIQVSGNYHPNQWRLPRTIMPFMESNSATVKIPWISNMNTFELFPSATTENSDMIQFNGGVVVTILSPLRRADTVDTSPILNIWIELENVAHGVYIPE